MPPKNRRAAVRAAAPTAKKAVAFLKKGGRPEMAEAVEEILGFALTAVEQADAHAARLEAAPTRNRALQVERAFRDHVNATKTDTLPAILIPYLEDFLAGTWTPGKPQRARRGTLQDKVNINVGVGDELWDAVDRLARDPEATTTRGYSLTASKVAIAALREALGTPQDSTTD